MNYITEKEDVLSLAREKVTEAAEALEEVLPDAAAELSWIGENIREELFAVRSAGLSRCDGEYEAGGAF